MAQKNKQMSKRLTQSIPALLTEIIIEILLKLPVESLLRCKSVCKQWYSLISDKHFIKTHYSLSSTNTNFSHLVFIFESRKLKSCPLNDVLFDNSVDNALEYRLNADSQIQIVGSCNGLLCIHFEETIYIYNPSTRILNRLLGRFDDPYFKVFGFGYDEFNDDYKVLVINSIDKVKIYSLRTGKWKNIPQDVFCFDAFGLSAGIFSNGALHWVGEINQNSGSSDQWKIYSIDLAKETFEKVLLPEYDEGNVDLMTLGALGQSFCVLCNYKKSHADLWVMKVYGVKDSWIKLASIPFSPMRHHFLNSYSYFMFSAPLCISNDGKVLLEFGGKYFVFDSKNISFTLVNKEIDANAEPYIYVESLVPPNFALGICNRLRSSRKR